MPMRCYFLTGQVTIKFWPVYKSRLIFWTDFEDLIKGRLIHRKVWYMAASLTVDKMKQILCCDWLPMQSQWRYLARSGLSVTRTPLFTINACSKSLIDQASGSVRGCSRVPIYPKRVPKIFTNIPKIERGVVYVIFM